MVLSDIMQGVNYFHVESKRLYEIGLQEAWKR
jgi:hypothetical protein